MKVVLAIVLACGLACTDANAQSTPDVVSSMRIVGTTRPQDFAYVPDADRKLQNLFAMVAYKDRLFGYHHYVIDPASGLLKVRLFRTDDRKSANLFRQGRAILGATCGEMNFNDQDGKPVTTVSYSWPDGPRRLDGTAQLQVPPEKWKGAKKVVLRRGFCARSEPPIDAKSMFQLTANRKPIPTLIKIQVR